ncbi:MAG: metallophosphoesterase [Bacteroidaceae bacterium]|nr:metallophosphoesterase [Bacteroidaceae bacterium]
MILRILFLLVILLLLPVWGIDRLILKNNWKLLPRLLFYLPNVVLLLSLVAVAINESYTLDAALVKGRLLTATLCLVIPETVVVLCLLFLYLLRKKEKLHRSLVYMVFVLGGGVFALLLYGFTLGYQHIVVRESIYQSAAVPKSFDGYKIVQLSDLHLGTLHGQPNVVRTIVEKVNALQPDLIVFTGDLVNYHAEELMEFEDILSDLQAPDGVLSVMGNHDYMTYHKWNSEQERLSNVFLLQERQRAMGWKLLLNEHVLIRRGCDSIAVLGVENDGRPPFPSLGDLPKAQKGLSSDCFQILLSHDPSHWRRAVLPDTDIPLMLAGHTHGMQFKVGNFSPAAWFYPEWGGEYTEDAQTLQVSLGIGSVMLPFRLGAWPEIHLITLRSAQK